MSKASRPEVGTGAKRRLLERATDAEERAEKAEAALAAQGRVGRLFKEGVGGD